MGNLSNKQASKQSNKQTTNITLCFWFGTLAWVLDLGSWFGTLAWVLEFGSWLQTDMDFHELELSMVHLTFFSDRVTIEIVG